MKYKAKYLIVKTPDGKFRIKIRCVVFWVFTFYVYYKNVFSGAIKEYNSAYQANLGIDEIIENEIKSNTKEEIVEMRDDE